ncbi:MAG: hypothetical protein HQ517_04275 [SAR324 cluster bacterium]|nr:hypothetical protein [SAR324 cluster bacterium]
MWNPPDFAERVIITPGINKYEKITKFREELLGQADQAIKKENVFLFIGYGFNDNHLETYINPKLKNQNCLGLIVTRDSNERIDKLMDESENLWLVCKKNKRNCENTIIHNKKYTAGLELPDKKLWDITEFTQEILGD